jgi:nitrogenase molybdenum-iron protein alpha/beta subunit
MVKVTKFLTGSVMGTSSLDVSGILIYPNPSTNSIHLKNGDRFVGAPYKLLDQLGKTVASGSVIKDSQKIDVSDLPGGVYTLILQDHTNQAVKVVIE